MAMPSWKQRLSGVVAFFSFGLGSQEASIIVGASVAAAAPAIELKRKLRRFIFLYYMELKREL
jgi:hypothetical protein